MQTISFEHDRQGDPRIRAVNRRNEEVWRLRWEQIEAAGYRLMSSTHTAAERNEQHVRALNLVPESAARALKPFEYFALELLGYVSRLRSELGREGGKAKKSDRLSDVIDEIVAEDPSISTKALLAEIIRIHEEPDSWITDITDEKITFEQDDKTILSVPVSGLKDRLTRAKNKSR